MAGSPSRNRPPNPSNIDELLHVLSDEHRRNVLYYLRDNERTANVGELSRHLSDQFTLDSEEFSTVLYHSVLPQLNDADVVHYEPADGQVRYRAGPLTTELIDRVANWERDEGD